MALLTDPAGLPIVGARNNADVAAFLEVEDDPLVVGLALLDLETQGLIKVTGKVTTPSGDVVWVFLLHDMGADTLNVGMYL